MHRRRQQIATWELVATLCAVWYFLRSPARLSASHLQIHLFIDSNVALGTLLRGTSRQSSCNDLDTGIWFEVAAQSSAAPRMTGSFEVESGRCLGAFCIVMDNGCSGCSSCNVSDGTVTHSTLTLVFADPWPFWIQRPLVGCANTLCLLSLMCSPSSFSSSFSEENHNVWCPLLELFFHWRIGRCMEAMVDEVSTAQVALTCHFALDVLCEK